MKSLILIQFVLIFQIQIYDLSSQTTEWRALPNSPYSSTRFEDIFFLNENTGWIIHGDGKVYRTTDTGQNWLLSQNILNRCIGFFNSKEGIIGTLHFARPLFKTTNAGINWIQITTLPDPPTGICGISIVNENTAIACGTYSGNGKAYKTTDKGDTWSLIFSDTSKARTLVDTYFWSPDSGLIAGGYNVSTYSNGVAVVLMTTNGGANWNTVHKTTRQGEWCWKINFYTSDKGVISLERHSGLSYFLKSTNKGLSWAETPFLVYDQEGIGFINDNTGWIGGWSGPTYETTNGGSNWSIAGWGEYVNRIRFLSDTLGYAVGDKVYKYSNYQVGINQTSLESSVAFYLYQNYPNPFNPKTLINYQIKKSAQVRILIYDILGSLIATIVNEKQIAGNYEVSFDGSELQSGIYFYRLETNGKVIGSKKMMLLK